MKLTHRTCRSMRSRSKLGTTQSRSKSVRPAGKHRQHEVSVEPQSAIQGPNGLAQRIFAALCKRHKGEEPSSQPLLNAPRTSDREMDRKALAVLLNIPQSRVTNAKLDKQIRQIRKDAEDDAHRIATYLAHLATHLTSIRCTTEGDIENYLGAEERVLSGLYAELRSPRPSPTKLLQLTVQYTLDARRAIKSTIPQMDIHPHRDSFKVAVLPPGRVKLRSLPYPGTVVRNPFAIQLLRFVRSGSPGYVPMMQLIELLLEHVPSFPDGPTPTARPPLPIEVNVDESTVTVCGKTYPVSFPGVRLLKLLTDDPGGWVAPQDYRDDDFLKNTRRDREIKKLPKPIRALIESKPGSGYRLSKKRLAELCQKTSIALPDERNEDSEVGCH